jgi:hypothetical protein
MSKSREELFRKTEEELAAREDLKRAEATIINTAGPKDLGSNEAARQANIRARTIEERDALEKAERAKREAALKYELDGLAVDCLKWQIRSDQAIADLDAQGYCP